MPHAAGGSLQQVIACGLRKPRWAAEVVRTVALAMQHAHDRGMLHRDLKPANVLLTAEGAPMVTDFGLVKFADPIRQVSQLYCTVASVNLLDIELRRFAAELGAQYGSVEDAAVLGEDEVTRSAWAQCAARTGVLGGDERFQSVRAFLNEAQEQARRGAAGPDLDGLTRSGTVMGSPSYMAPEQAAGNLARIGPRTDVYSLGGILYALLTGHPPFGSQSTLDLLSQVCSARPTRPRQSVPDVSGDIEAICLKCLEKLPEDRYQTAAALAEDLERFVDGYSPRGAPPASPITTGGVPSSAPPTAGTPQGGGSRTRSWWPFGRSRSKASSDPAEPGNVSSSGDS